MSLTPGNFYSGSGVPLVGDGSNGDHYRDTTNQNLWAKSGGIWSLVGNLNLSVPDGVGTFILQGSGTPVNPLGSDGFYYRNTDNQDLWFKQVGIWNLLGTLNSSAAGIVPGTLFLDGAGVPSGGLGENGNYYRDTSTSEVYKKAAGTWTSVGNWGATPPAGTVIITGTGVPSGAVGANGNYFRDEDTEDVYIKESGAWRWIGNWAGPAPEAFTIATWDMTGASLHYTAGSATAGTLSGSDPNQELTPNASALPGASGIYLSGAEGISGLPVTGSATTWARLVKPSTTGGDNLLASGFVLYNSGATLTDVLAVLNGGTPTENVWALVATNRVATSAYASVQLINKNVLTSGSDLNLSLVAGDDLFVGFEQSTKKVKVQRNTGTIFDLGTLNIGTMPASQTLKLAVVALFSNSTPIFSAVKLTFDLSTTSAGKTPFSTVGDAVIPVGVEDGDILEVITSGGTYNGVQTQVGDYVQVYSNLTKILRVPQSLGTVLGNSGKNYKIVSGVVRQATAGAGWELIDDANHKPINVGDVSVVGDKLRITYAFTAVNKGAFSAWPDETFASWGMQIGASVGNSYTDLEIYGDLGAEIMGSDLTEPVRSQTPLGLKITSQVNNRTMGKITVNHGTQSHSSGYGTPVAISSALNNGYWTVDSRKDSFDLTYRRGCIGQVTVTASVPALNTQIAYPADVGILSVVKSGTTVTAVADNGSGLIRVTLAESLGATPGSGNVVISGATTSGGMILNGTSWTLLPVDGATLQYDLQASTFVGAWVSGGTVSTGKLKVTLADDTMDLYSGHVVNITGVLSCPEALGEHVIQRISASKFELDGTVWATDATPGVGTASMIKVRWNTNHFEVFHPYAGVRQFTQIQSQRAATLFHFLIDTYAYPTVGFEVYAYDSAGAAVTSISDDMKFNYDREVLLPAVIPETLVGFVSRSNVPCAAGDIYSASGNIWFMGIFEV